ncbi:DUF397 domain-containing protein [Yinghuangia seranimata]|uniref:DUF397 domain-containing protein n=1 Tax=Yinghuangia seranimata TaxID=408067 RepID=UPI00248B4745|nr:DUF397 domain-containing protein [Yinghuangia seranimata]MDI2126986.1 DUF397 domain-containing protein [Yinghuangia seranimata]
MRELNLYEIEIPDGLPAYKACGGNQGGGDDTETCPTLREVPGVDGGLWIMGDTKRPGAELRFTTVELLNAGIDPARFDKAV